MDSEKVPSSMDSEGVSDSMNAEKKKLFIMMGYKIPIINVDMTIKNRIDNLPIDIQKKICIYVWREYWRNYVPVIAKVPSWYERKIRVDKKLLESKINNIHFLHLDFNTLPENKKWIMGCQCDFCKSYERINRNICNSEYDKQYNDSDYYYDNGLFNIDGEKWTGLYYKIANMEHETLLMGYDALFGSKYENYDKWAIRNKVQLHFES